MVMGRDGTARVPRGEEVGLSLTAKDESKSRYWSDLKFERGDDVEAGG